jgi:hypothetical protein
MSQRDTAACSGPSSSATSARTHERTCPRPAAIPRTRSQASRGCARCSMSTPRGRTRCAPRRAARGGSQAAPAPAADRIRLARKAQRPRRARLTLEQARCCRRTFLHVLIRLQRRARCASPKGAPPGTIHRPAARVRASMRRSGPSDCSSSSSDSALCATLADSAAPRAGATLRPDLDVRRAEPHLQVSTHPPPARSVERPRVSAAVDADPRLDGDTVPSRRL